MGGCSFQIVIRPPVIAGYLAETVGNDSRRAWHVQQRIYLEVVADTSLLRAYTVVGVDPQFFYLYT